MPVKLLSRWSRVQMGADSRSSGRRGLEKPGSRDKHRESDRKPRTAAAAPQLLSCCRLFWCVQRKPSDKRHADRTAGRRTLAANKPPTRPGLASHHTPGSLYPPVSLPPFPPKAAGRDWVGLCRPVRLTLPRPQAGSGHQRTSSPLLLRRPSLGRAWCCSRRPSVRYTGHHRR